MDQAVKVDDVTWVLTVPVCCSEPAKHFMRQAAIQAGLIKGGDDDEVDSAILQCHTASVCGTCHRRRVEGHTRIVLFGKEQRLL